MFQIFLRKCSKILSKYIDYDESNENSFKICYQVNQVELTIVYILIMISSTQYCQCFVSKTSKIKIIDYFVMMTY